MKEKERMMIIKIIIINSPRSGMFLIQRQVLRSSVSFPIALSSQKHGEVVRM